MTPSNDPNNSSSGGSSSHSDDLSQYLQAYLDESAEELDSLVEGLLRLEIDPRDTEALNKSFRMLHSLKGSSGLMGFEIVGNFAHELENRFERYRAGTELIDRDATTVILQCVDFFRAFFNRLRDGDPTQGDPSELLTRLEGLNRTQASVSPAAAKSRALDPTLTLSGGMRVQVKFRAGLQLADLKARLIVSRLSAIGEVVACDPPIDDVSSFEDLQLFSLTLLTDRAIDEVRRIASVDGVESLEVEGTASAAAVHSTELLAEPQVIVAAVPKTVHQDSPRRPNESIEREAPHAEVESHEARSQVGETLRIDINRLDDLMNLTGELIVANSRFSQITGEMSPLFRKQKILDRSNDLRERLCRRFEFVRLQANSSTNNGDDWRHVFDGLDEELDELNEQAKLWSEGRRQFSEITEAVDQLTRVSKKLQRGVLKTRMVPVGPLFNRFKRVVRDLSVERGKRVQLAILGEKTELDKRMIDALGDPLLHLVRNAIDHGFESPDERRDAGKPEFGSIVLAASQRGNNVLITVSDDGRGIDAAKVRTRLISRGLASESQVAEMSEQQLVDCIWQPGFSTAERVTEISGRGVGMDIVRNAISDLSGTIDAVSTPGAGTQFTIRLPLTLAIIHSLVFQFEDGLFSIPIDDVREIVAVPPDQVHSVHRCLTIEIRGQIIPVVTMDAVFHWNRSSGREQKKSADRRLKSNGPINVVILQSRGKILGLCVDALVGRADIVIKSLADNFTPIRGLSGASILGDGTVCLMLDSTMLVDLAAERAVVSP